MSDTFVIDKEGKPADITPPEAEAEDEAKAPPADDDAPDDKGEDQESEGDSADQAEQASDDESGDDEAADADDDEDEGEKPKKSRNRVSASKRIGQLTAQVRGLERQLQQVRQPAQPAEAAKMPKQDDFENYEDYIDARAAYVARQTFADEARRAREADHAARQERIADEFRARSDAAAEKYDDYDEVIAASDVPITDAMGHAIMESEVGPDISYHLAKHPEEARKIASMSPIGQVRELGKLEAKLTAPKPTPPKKTTAAPAPPKTLKPAGKPTVDEDKLPIDDWMARERKRLREAGKL